MPLIDTSQTTLLRLAAFLVDSLTLAIVLILPASVISYAMAWIGGSVKSIQLVWWITLGVFVLGILLRDGRGRSPGKNLLGLRLTTRSGGKCGWGRSIARNIPLIVPGWNLVEVFLVVRGRSRTGDRIGRTSVAEE